MLAPTVCELVCVTEIPLYCLLMPVDVKVTPPVAANTTVVLVVDPRAIVPAAGVTDAVAV